MDLVRTTVKLLGARAGKSALQLLGTIYFVRELGPGPIGTFFLFQATLLLLGIFADAGLAGALEKRVSEGDREGAFLSAAILLKAIAIATVLCAIAAFAAHLDAFLGMAIAGYLAVGIVLQEAARHATAALKGELRVGEIASIEVARMVTWVVVGVALLHRGHHVSALVIGHLAGLLVKLAWSATKCAIEPALPTAADCRSLLAYARFDVVSALGVFVYSWMDVLIIGALLTEAHVGAYELSWRIASTVLMLSHALGSVLFPQISNWEARDALARIESSVRNSITSTMALSIPALFGTVLLSRDILRIVFGPAVEHAWLVLVLLVAVNGVGAVNVVLDNALRGVDRPDAVAYATVATLVANVALNVVLVDAMGIEGAAVGTGASVLLAVAINATYLSRFVAIEVQTRVIGWFVAAAAIMALGLRGLRAIVPVEGVVTLLLAVAAGVGLYVGVLLAYPPFRRWLHAEVRAVRDDGTEPA